MFSNEDAEPPRKALRGLLWREILVYQNYQLMSGHKQGNARYNTHSQLHPRTPKSKQNVYISSPVHLSLCNGTPANSIRNIYISRTKLPLSNHSIENHPPASGFPALLQIATVATDYVGKRRGSPNES